MTYKFENMNGFEYDLRLSKMRGVRIAGSAPTKGGYGVRRAEGGIRDGTSTWNSVRIQGAVGGRAYALGSWWLLRKYR